MYKGPYHTQGSSFCEGKCIFYPWIEDVMTLLRVVYGIADYMKLSH